jgi:hypothetical protein
MEASTIQHRSLPPRLHSLFQGPFKHLIMLLRFAANFTHRFHSPDGIALNLEADGGRSSNPR